MKNNFIQRAITGALFVVILVGCIFYSPLSFGILIPLSRIERTRVCPFGKQGKRRSPVSTKTITALGGALSVPCTHGDSASAIDARVFLPYLGLLLYLMITGYLKKENPHRQLGVCNAEPAICSLAFRTAECTRFPDSPETSSVTYNPILPLSVFVFIWLAIRVLTVWAL